MFKVATSFTGAGLANWDTGRVVQMGNMFNRASVFDEDVSSWDTAHVTSMPGVFAEAAAFKYDSRAKGQREMTNRCTTAVWLCGCVTVWLCVWDGEVVVKLCADRCVVCVMLVLYVSRVWTHTDTGVPLRLPLIRYGATLHSWNTSRVTDMAEILGADTGAVWGTLQSCDRKTLWLAWYAIHNFVFIN